MGCGDAGMEAAEQVIRAGLLKLGGSMLEQLLAADNGYRGPRVPCGQGHEAAFAGCREERRVETALGYFEDNAPRMRYHWFRQCGLFVGSGVVEARRGRPG